MAKSALESASESSKQGPALGFSSPEECQHTFWNAGTDEARLIEIITPGAFAHYFEELAGILSKAGFRDEERLAELRSRYGLSFSSEWVPALKAKYGLRLVGE